MENVVDSIARRVPQDGNTYVGDDGLLYCRKCHTARQNRIVLLGKEKTVPCLCQCMADQLDREEAEAKRRERALDVQRYRDLGFSDSDLRACTFAVDDGASPKLTQAMKVYVENFKDFRRSGKGLLLYGNVGTGKSFYAACIVNALIDAGYPCLMTNFSRLTNKINGMWEGKQDYIDSLSRFALIAIDDLGVERDSDYMNENVTVIIDNLYRAKVPLIITSNYTPKQLTAADSEIRKRRVYDRLLERCHPVKVDGFSRRREKGRNEFIEMDKILGLR